MSKSARCTACQTRPIGGGEGQTFTDRQDAKNSELCVPCLEEGYWSNIHSDYGHESLATDATADEMDYALADCWICHPELDTTGAEYVERSGTSRAGIVLHVSPRTTGASKAAQVADQLPKWDRKTLPVKKGNPYITLAVRRDKRDAATITWEHGTGRLVSAFTIIAGNQLKARNVSEVLKRLAEVEDDSWA